MQYIDIHTHLNLDAFNDDWKDVGNKCVENEVALINVGTDKEKSERAIDIAESFESGVYATVGAHPTCCASGDENVFNIEEYISLAEHEKVVAIGECGLDYFRASKETKDKQESALIEQIELANIVKKPLMLHIRPSEMSMDAYEDAIKILKKHAKILGNAHFFAGTLEIAKQFWDIGFSTSFTGVITFTNDYDEVIKNAPLEMLHAETDAPYVAPVPYRGQRNEPLFVREVYKRIAEIREENEEKIRIQLIDNAQKLFGVL